MRTGHLGLTLVLLLSLCVATFLYFAEVPHNPPGFYIDESSIAYNAYCISQNGRDEYGEMLPLYFSAFGDYKNPVFIYLLAAVFRITGPGIAVARSLSAVSGLLAAVLLGLLAWKITRILNVSLLIIVIALLTPWLFEASRLVFEVSIYPAVTALFLICIWNASRQPRWNVVVVVSIALSLALLTYSYSIGRLLAPLLAAGLVLFSSRQRWKQIIITWASYLITLIPLFVFNRRHPGALTSRFNSVTYITAQSSWLTIIRSFVRYYLIAINPWRWLASGEGNIRDHVIGTGVLLAISFALVVWGIVAIWKRGTDRSWWRFVIYGLIVAPVPAALTVNEFPQLRLIAVPVFLIVLMIPALERLNEWQPDWFRNVAWYVVIALVLAQSLYFRWLFHRAGPPRWYIFDARFERKVLEPALATGQSPIYLDDGPGKSGYIQALWYGSLKGLPRERFERGQPSTIPAGSVVISSEENCVNCKVIAKSINYLVYLTEPVAFSSTTGQLPDEAHKAELICERCPSITKAHERVSLSLLLRNVTNASWPAVDGSDGRGAVVIRARWLITNGQQLAEPAELQLPYDLEPGDTAGLSLPITAPPNPGDYVLEIDLAQRGFATFSQKGWTPVRWRMTVER